MTKEGIPPSDLEGSKQLWESTRLTTKQIAVATGGSPEDFKGTRRFNGLDPETKKEIQMKNNRPLDMAGMSREGDDEIGFGVLLRDLTNVLKKILRIKK